MMLAPPWPNFSAYEVPDAPQPILLWDEYLQQKDLVSYVLNDAESSKTLLINRLDRFNFKSRQISTYYICTQQMMQSCRRYDYAFIATYINQDDWNWVKAKANQILISFDLYLASVRHYEVSSQIKFYNT